MAMVSTFGAFTTARLGIYAAQQGLSVTGNNISNINTPGYTRQKLDQVSLYNKGSDRYVTAYGAARIGNGALVTGVSQLRDPFLDIRYRTEAARVGYTDETVYGLQQIADIIDEVGKGDDEHGILEAALSEFRTRLNNLVTNAGENSFDTQVRTAASSLVRLFNSYADQLSKLESNTQKKLSQDVDAVNKILSNIRDLNDAIRKSDIHGDKALEQRDERNRLIDELAQYIKIDASYSMEDIGGGVMVEKLTIALDGANSEFDKDNTDMTVLIDGVYGSQLTVDGKEETAGGDPVEFPYQFHVSALTDKHGKALEYKDGTKSQPVDLKDNDLYGSLQATREMLTESGDFATDTMLASDRDAASKRGIPYYQQSLDLLARQFAETFNKANNGYLTDMNGNLVTKGKVPDPADESNPPSMIDGTVPLLDANGDPIKASDLTEEELAQLEADGKIIRQGGNLFSNNGNSNDAEGITAANISVAKDWADSKMRIVRSFKVLDGKLEPESTDSSNILHMVSLMDQKQDYYPKHLAPDAKEDQSVFNGSFQEMLTKIASTLGGDLKSDNTLLNNYYLSAVDLDTSRDSVSSVDLNDEATNLMQYQKAYTAACRLMTTLDEALDKLINGTGTVGR